MCLLTLLIFRKNMKRLGMLNSFAILLIVVGICLYGAAIFIRNNNASVQSQPPVTAENNKRPVLDKETISGKPIELKIPTLNIDNAVIDGYYNSKSREWTLTTDKVQHAVSTFAPNNSTGLTFMYGHNRKEVFSRLPAIKPGAILTIRTDNRKLFTYRYRESTVVKPADASVFEYTGKPLLVLQTCTGLYYQNRQLFYFDFIEVQDA